MTLIDENCPLISRELLTPWRLASLAGGLALLVVGSVALPSDDWDLAICFVMGLPAYVLAPWTFRQVWYMRWRYLPFVVLALLVTIDGSYTLYWHLRGFQYLPEFRLANYVYCLPLFWMSGFVWNIGRRGERFQLRSSGGGIGARRLFPQLFRIICCLAVILVVSILVGWIVVVTIPEVRAR